MYFFFPLYFRQVPAVGEPSSGTSSSTQSPPLAKTPVITRFSQVQNQDDLVCFLRAKLMEKSEHIKYLEAQLKVAESKEHLVVEHEEFLLSELATIVDYLDCEFAVLSFSWLHTIFFLCVTLLFCRYPRKRC